MDYVGVRLTFDLIWPVVYVSLLLAAVSWPSGQAFTPRSLWQRASLVPVISTLSDHFENGAAALVAAAWAQADRHR